MAVAGLTFPVFNIGHFDGVLPTIEKRLQVLPGNRPVDPRLAGKRTVLERPSVEIPLRFKKRPKLPANVLADESERSVPTLSDATPASLDIGMSEAPAPMKETDVSLQTTESHAASSMTATAMTATMTPAVEDREEHGSPRRRSRSPLSRRRSRSPRSGSGPVPMERALKSLDRDLTGKINAESRRLSRILENRADGVHRRIDRCISPIRGDLNHLEHKVSGLSKDTAYLRNKVSTLPTIEVLRKTVEEASVDVLAQAKQNITERITEEVPAHVMALGKGEISSAITAALRDDIGGTQKALEDLRAGLPEVLRDSLQNAIRHVLPDVVESSVSQTLTDVIKREVGEAVAGLRQSLPQMVSDVLRPQIAEMMSQAAHIVATGNARITAELDGFQMEVDGLGGRIEEVGRKVDEVGEKADDLAGKTDSLAQKTDGRMADVLQAQLQLSNMLGRGGSDVISSSQQLVHAQHVQEPDLARLTTDIRCLDQKVDQLLTIRNSGRVESVRTRRSASVAVTDVEGSTRNTALEVTEGVACVDLVREAYGIPKGMHWNGFKVPGPPGTVTTLRNFLANRAYFVEEGSLIQSKGRMAIVRARVQDFLAAMEKEVPTIVTSDGEEYRYGSNPKRSPQVDVTMFDDQQRPGDSHGQRA